MSRTARKSRTFANPLDTSIPVNFDASTVTPSGSALFTDIVEVSSEVVSSDPAATPHNDTAPASNSADLQALPAPTAAEIKAAAKAQAKADKDAAKAAAPPKVTKKGQVLALIKAAPCTLQALAKEMGIGEGAVSSLIADLRRDGVTVTATKGATKEEKTTFSAA